MTQDVADTIYVNGTIVTMDEAHPGAEAVAVKDGKILKVGANTEIKALQGPATRVVDLTGKTMLPGFIDGHSHFINAVRFADWPCVAAPPVGTCSNIDEVVALLQEHVKNHPPKPGEWLCAWGYDGTTLAEKRDMTRQDLDGLFKYEGTNDDIPVMLQHVSLHGAVLNTAAFNAGGVGLFDPTPGGGFTARIPGTDEAAGLLMENSFMPIYLNMPKDDEETTLSKFAAAQDVYARSGYTTFTEAPIEPDNKLLMMKAADRGLYYLDFIGYLNWQEYESLRPKFRHLFKEGYKNRFRWGGVKIVVDGSPQGKTAYWGAPLLTPGPGGEPDWCGHPSIEPEWLNTLVALAHGDETHVLIHCNGDAAIQMALDADKAAGSPKGRRMCIIHSQFVTPAQIDTYVERGVVPSFFTNHTFFWGDVHLENLGEPRAFFMSPLKTARAKGLRMTNHSDYAVTPLDPMFITWTAMNRRSRTDVVIGKEERVNALDALKCLTIDAAYQYWEEGTKGSIVAGKLADFAVLDGNPLTTPADKVKDIKVVMTIKEDRRVFPDREAAATRMKQ